jgi:hypothetical protein
MHIMNYDTMPAGREMDALVAEKVMGLLIHAKHVCGMTGFGYELTDTCPGCREVRSGPFYDGKKRYSTDIAAAWEVVLLRDDWWFDLASFSRFTAWEVRIETDDSNFVGFADTAPLAICRAALKAKER